MFLEVRIKLRTPLLGSQQTKERIRRFIKGSDKHIKLNAAQWMKAFHQAAKELRIENLDFAAIRLPEELYAPTLMLHTRNFNFKGAPREELFESIQTGAVLGFKVMVLDRSESARDDEHAPTLDEFSRLLSCIGEWIGLSPFGGQFNYGRFVVSSIDLL